MKNRVVLITGGNRGIGYAAAKKFLEEGETVILTARNMEANNLYGSNILINSLCPGWVRTDMGGKSATRSSYEAASDIYELSNNDNLQGKFVRYGKVIKF